MVSPSVSRFWENQIPIEVPRDDKFGRLKLLQCTCIVKMVHGYTNQEKFLQSNSSHLSF